MKLRITSLCALLFVCATSVIARAAEPCGSLKLELGQVRIGKPMTQGFFASDDGKRCVADIAKTLGENRLLRAITVANHATEAQQAGGKALAEARALVDALVAAGLPKNRIFAVAPRADDTTATGIVIRYTERAPDNVVARIASASGAVRVGADASALRPVERLMPLLVNDLVDTGDDGQALIELKDGSGIRLSRNTRIKMARLDVGEEGGRAIHLEVISGQIEAEVRRAAQGSSFEASSRVAVASVRGTMFRLDAEPQGDARLETLEGKVRLASAVAGSAQAVDVPADRGSRARRDGLVDAPRALPAAPTVIAPKKGALDDGAPLRFSAVADAAEYHIEVARDADLIIDAKHYIATATSYVISDQLAAGKWFWRVSAKSSAGFTGRPSKVYSFEVVR